jgi:hypothetical protein
MMLLGSAYLIYDDTADFFKSMGTYARSKTMPFCWQGVRAAKPPVEILERMVPLVFLNTAFCQAAGEEKDPESDSTGNQEEVRVAWRQCRLLLAAGVPAEDIAILSPYTYQVMSCFIGPAEVYRPAQNCKGKVLRSCLGCR